MEFLTALKLLNTCVALSSNDLNHQKCRFEITSILYKNTLVVKDWNDESNFDYSIYFFILWTKFRRLHLSLTTFEVLKKTEDPGHA
jgi:hypothetical protein